jgi:hypothetical protein
MKALYGSVDYAVLPIEVVRSKTIVNDNPAMRGYVRAARCDGTGAFVFDKLPAGPYFIIAEVNEAAGQKVIMRRVSAVSGRILQAGLFLEGQAAGPLRMGDVGQETQGLDPAAVGKAHGDLGLDIGLGRLFALLEVGVDGGPIGV